MKRILFFVLLTWVGLSCAKTSSQAPYPYGVAESPWSEALGNHRAVLTVDEPAEAVMLSFDWRRPDKEVDNRRFLVVNAVTGDTISNIKRIAVDNEQCKLIFGPVKTKGTYYFYYLPYQVQPGYGNYNRGYYPKEDAPDRQWVETSASAGQLPEAKIVRVESRTDFDSFYPMEIIASAKEKNDYRKAHPGRFMVFNEYPAFPKRNKYQVPYKMFKKNDH